MIRAHKIRLHPMPEQAASYRTEPRDRCPFCVELGAVTEWNRHYEAGEKPTALQQKADLMRSGAKSSPGRVECHQECF